MLRFGGLQHSSALVPPVPYAPPPAPGTKPLDKKMPTLKVRDVDLYYETLGEGEPLLFMHGLGSSTRDWAEQVAFFSGHYRVVAFDARGHGRSSKPPGPYTLPLLAADAADLVRRLGLAPAHVLGLSMGGMVAFQLAADAPHLVRSLTVTNSGPSFHLTPSQRRQYAWRRPLIQLLGMRGVGVVLGRRLFPRPADAALRQRFVERWADNDRRVYVTALDGFAGWSVEEKLSAITCPALIVAAEHDYTPVAYKRAYAAKMPNARVAVISDARHAAPVERPQAFNERVASFLASGA